MYILIDRVMNKKDWLKFELNSEISPTEEFEVGFCREFFAIQEGLKLEDVRIIKGMKGIENEPINGIAFQSKYLTKWDWKQIRESLVNIKEARKKLEKPFDELKKVYIYVKELGSSAYLKDNLIQELKDLGIEIILFIGFDKIYTEQEYSKLKKYFVLKQDINLEIKLLEKYIENLFLNEAKDILDIIAIKFDDIEDKQKHNFYFYTWKLELFKFLYKEKGINKDFHNNLLIAYDFSKNDKSLLNKAVGLYNMGNIVDAKKICDTLSLKGNFNPELYQLELTIKKDEFNNFEDFLKTIKIEYRNNKFVKRILGNICREKEGIIRAFEEFYREKDYSKIEKLTDKIDYFQNWNNYLQEKYGLHNLPLEAKEEYIKLNIFIDSFVNDLEGKELYIEDTICNSKLIINFQVLGNIERAIFYYRKIENSKNLDGYIKWNFALILLETGKIEYIEEARNILEDLVNNFDKYLNKSPNRDVLFQVHSILAGLHFQTGDKKECGRILQEFKDKYYDRAELHYKRFFGLTDIQVIEDRKEAGEKTLKYLKEDNCIIYNLLAFHIFDDKKYIKDAYSLYENGQEKSFNDLSQLAELLLYRLEDEKRYFEIMNDILIDFSQKRHFKNYIITGIHLNKVKIVETKLEEYRKSVGFKKDKIYIKFKSYLESQKGKIKEAIKIIENFNEKDVELLNEKAALELQIGDNNSAKKTLKKLYELGKKNDFENFSNEDKLVFIQNFYFLNQEESLKLCYSFLQKDLDKKYFNEFLSLYHAMFLRGGDFKDNSSNIDINENTIIKIQKIGDNDKILIAIDGYTNKIFGIDKIFSNSDFEYKRLIGRKKGDEIINLFSGEPIFGIDSKYRIVEIINKYVYLQQIIYSKFLNDIGAIKIYIPNKDNGELDFSDFFELLNNQGKQNKEKKDYINENFTKKGLLSFGIIKFYYGCSYIDIYYQKDFNLKQSDIVFKLEKGEELKDLIIDISGIITIFELGIENLFLTLNLYISQSTFLYFTSELATLKGDNSKSEFSLFSDGEGHFSRVDTPKDYKKKRIEYIEKILNWLNINCKIATSDLLVGNKDEIVDIFGKEFFDTLLIAGDKRYYLFSDDIVVRKFARSQDNNNVKAFGIESLLIYLNSKNLINNKVLIESYLKLIKLDFLGLYIISDFLYYFVVKGNKEELDLVIAYVKNKYDDLKFLVSTLVTNTIKQKNSIFTLQNGIQFNLTNEGIKYYFNILLENILKYYTIEEVKKVFIESIKKVEGKNMKLLLKQLFDSF